MISGARTSAMTAVTGIATSNSRGKELLPLQLQQTNAAAGLSKISS